MTEYSDKSESTEIQPPHIEEEYTVIIDIGEASTKVGFAGEEAPRSMFPTITGAEKYKNVMVDVGASGRPQIYVGDDCHRMRGVLKISYPINRGAIMDWDAYFAILTHIFYNVLRIDPSRANVIYTESALTAAQMKQYIARVLFETYRAKSVYIASAPIMALFSAGLTTGIVVESGEGLTWVVPVINGKIFEPAVQRLTLAGVDVCEYLKTLLLRYGITLSSSSPREILRDIKDKYCFMALNPEDTVKKQKDVTSYVLPDGEKVNIPIEVRVYAPEVMFHPELLGYNVLSLPQAIITAVSKVERFYWRPLLSNIVLSGGNTIYPGIELRLEQEIGFLLPQLGPLPEPEKKELPPPKPKMVNIAASDKVKDTCAKCGALVNLQVSKVCPECGSLIESVTINIPGEAITKYAETCSKCKKKLDGKSEFCPFCGAKLEKVVVSKAPSLKAVEVAPIFDDVDKMDASEFDDESVDKNKPLKDIRIVLPEKRQHAIFNGASVLGALSSFKKIFITYQEFLQDPFRVDADFSQML
jgi:actin-related protein